MRFVPLKHCLKYNSILHVNANKASRYFVVNRFNSTVHDNLWHKNKLDENLKHDKETRTISYSSKNFVRVPLSRRQDVQSIFNDDVYDRLKLLQQKRSLKMGSVNRAANPEKEVEKESGGSGTSSGDQQNKGKPLDKRVLIGVFVFFVSSGIFFRMYMEEDEEKKKKKASGGDDHVSPVRFPKSSSDIPDEVPYLLIGGGTASFAAFRAIKTNDAAAKILVISKEPYNPYMRPPLSKEMFHNEDRSYVKNLKFKQWNGTVRSLFYEPEEFYIPCKSLSESEHGGISVAQGWSVKALDPSRKIAYLNDGKKIKYDKCLLATGSRPKVEAPFDELSDSLKKKVNFYRGVKDFEKLEHAIARGASSIVVVGNGFLGSELSCALGKRGKKKLKVVQVFKEDQLMSKVLPSYLCKWTTEKVLNEGVTVRSESEVVGLNEKGDKVELVMKDGSKLLADQVVVATGAEPVVDLAQHAGLEVDSGLGGFLVNSELSARSDLYAAGDCCCFYDVDLGRRRVEHHDHAVISGRLAGQNMTGAQMTYTHQPMFWSDLGSDIGFEAIGIVDSTLPTVGVFTRDNDDTPSDVPPEEYNKGVVFYLRNQLVVGILLWNLFNKMDVARLILREKKEYKDLNEVAKLFNIHSIKEAAAAEAAQS